VILEYEYQREVPVANNRKDARMFYSVFLMKNNGMKDESANLAQHLVREGLAKVMSYSTRDQERSRYYNDLEKDFESAKLAKKGWHDPVFEEPEYVDLSLSKKSMKGFCDGQLKQIWANFFDRASNTKGTKSSRRAVNATVEFVFGGHKVKVRVDMKEAFPNKWGQKVSQFSHHMRVQRKAFALFLEGIECLRGPPITGANRKTVDQMNEGERRRHESGEEAKRFVDKITGNSKVQILVTNKDRNDNFLGTIFVRGADKKNKDIAELLLKEGLAKCRDQLRNRQQLKDREAKLLAAEEEARNNKVGLWAWYKDPTQRTSASQPVVEAKKEEVLQKEEDVEVTQVDSGVEFWGKRQTKETLDRDKMICDMLANYPKSAPKKPPVKNEDKSSNFKRNMIVAGKFVDGNYYRCKIEKQLDQDPKNPRFSARFIDYGNGCNIHYSDLELLPGRMQEIPPLARRFKLAYLKIKSESAVFNDSGTHLNMLLNRKVKIRAMPDLTDGTGTQVILMDGDKSVNEEMLSLGLCRMISGLGKRRGLDPQTQAYLEACRKNQAMATRNRKGIFRYGDVDTDDEDDTY